MVRDWASTFVSWSKPPSETEGTRCSNAERMIRDAIKGDTKLSSKNIRVFTQGSYRHNTNVRLDSDVDIGVCLLDTFFTVYPDANLRETETLKAKLNFSDSSYTFKAFKNDVETALVNKFGRSGVTRGNKAIDVHANTYRVDADVVACFEHRRYTGAFDIYGEPVYLSGTQFLTDTGESIINWPEQNAKNGIQKNNATNYRYKFCVRIVKRLRNEMQGNNIAAAQNIPSFLIESLLWNAPNSVFNIYGSYVDILRAILAYLYNETMNNDSCKEWGEVNELKFLFNWLQPWTRQQAHNFIGAAWDYVGLE